MRGTVGVVLAAGRGKRMLSPLPKALLELRGKPLLVYTTTLLKRLGVRRRILVVGHQGELIIPRFRRDYRIVWQRRQLGNAHALKVALGSLHRRVRTVIVLNVDSSALLSPATLKRLLSMHETKKLDVTVAVRRITQFKGIGGIAVRAGQYVPVETMRHPLARSTRLVNAGVFIFSKHWIARHIGRIKRNASSREYHLSEIIRVASEWNAKLHLEALRPAEVSININTLRDLKKAERLLARRRRRPGA